MQLAEIQTQELVLELREKLMTYFKGDCVRTLTTRRQVTVDSLDSTTRYLYERRENDIHSRRRLTVLAIPFVELSKEPHMVTFYTDAINSNKELSTVRTEVEVFLDKYLPNVKIGEVYGTITN
jgi:hypothetical protein